MDINFHIVPGKKNKNKKGSEKAEKAKSAGKTVDDVERENMLAAAHHNGILSRDDEENADQAASGKKIKKGMKKASASPCRGGFKRHGANGKFSLGCCDPL